VVRTRNRPIQSESDGSAPGASAAGHRLKGYTRLSSRVVYENPWARLEVHDIIHPSGEPGEHTLIKNPTASAIVAIDGEDVMFTSQRRFAIDKVVLEIPKGGAHGTEDALATAKREAREEIGLVAEDWTSLGITYEIPSVVEQPVNLFLAQRCRFIAATPDRVESIERVRMPLARALELAREGGIDDAVTVVALWRAAAQLGLGTAAVERR